MLVLKNGKILIEGIIVEFETMIQFISKDNNQMVAIIDINGGGFGAYIEEVTLIK